ncbi:MAG: dockerin type I domain-containing protein, partial [Gammaproteobacteria bacterium]|nr:dockerin type I domain-containing protein [Gammaproteobacteria bacterium]
LLAFGEFDMDVDESGTVDSRDSILVARYLLGVTGAALTFGQTGAATEDVGDKVAAGKADASGHLDVDGDNDTDADDGILITRYMFGLRGAALVAGIGDLEESDASGIEAKIAALPSP